MWKGSPNLKVRSISRFLRGPLSSPPPPRPKHLKWEKQWGFGTHNTPKASLKVFLTNHPNFPSPWPLVEERVQMVKCLLKHLQTLLCSYHSFWCLAQNINLILTPVTKQQKSDSCAEFFLWHVKCKRSMDQHLQNYEEKVFVNQEFCSMSNYLQHWKLTERHFY